jgi:UDP-glucuronate decarboxylase
LRILVTGAAGFLGSHLCESLLLRGDEVIGLDNYYTGSHDNIAILKKFEKFSFIESDVTKPFDIDVNGIFNLACPASPLHYQRNPVETIRTSFVGALNVLDNARKYGAKVLQASTSEVYGDPNVSPQSEEYWGNVNPIGIRSCYDEGKRAAETLFFDFHREYGTKIKVARIFNTYGPRMQFNDGRVISNFVHQALTGNALTIYGDGSQTRSFCYVDDLISGLISFFDTSDSVTGPINIGNPEEFSIRQVALLVNELSGNQNEFIYKNQPLDDPKTRCPDVSKAKQLFNWNPQCDLRNGIEATIADFKFRLRT